jgi:hypothetical protein
MLVCESMDACISVCTVAESSIHHSCHLIPSVEFSPTNSLEDEGKVFIQSNPLEQVHIVCTSVTKLLQESGSTPLPPVSCNEGMKDEDRAESCDPSPEHEPGPRLDGPDENACFTPPINFFILREAVTL